MLNQSDLQKQGSAIYAMMHVLVHYKPSYRTTEAEHLGLGKVDANNPLIQLLVKNNFVRIASNGAILPDKKGIVAFCKIIPRSMLGEYRTKLENVCMTFPLSGDVVE